VCAAGVAAHKVACGLLSVSHLLVRLDVGSVYNGARLGATQNRLGIVLRFRLVRERVQIAIWVERLARQTLFADIIEKVL